LCIPGARGKKKFLRSKVGNNSRWKRSINQQKEVASARKRKVMRNSNPIDKLGYMEKVENTNRRESQMATNRGESNLSSIGGGQGGFTKKGGDKQGKAAKRKKGRFGVSKGWGGTERELSRTAWEKAAATSKKVKKGEKGLPGRGKNPFWRAGRIGSLHGIKSSKSGTFGLRAKAGGKKKKKSFLGGDVGPR